MRRIGLAIASFRARERPAGDQNPSFASSDDDFSGKLSVSLFGSPRWLTGGLQLVPEVVLF